MSVHDAWPLGTPNRDAFFIGRNDRCMRDIGGDGSMDVVEAFQYLKCFIRQDLLFCKLHDPSVLSEYGYGNEDGVLSQDSEELILEVDVDSDVNTSIFE